MNFKIYQYIFHFFTLFLFTVYGEVTTEDLNSIIKDNHRYTYEENIKRLDNAILANQTEPLQLAIIYNQKASYLYNRKKYNDALKYYIISNKISVELKNDLLNYSSLYGIALIKLQLQDYTEAKKLLKTCSQYFKQNITKGDNQEGLVSSYGKLAYINILEKNIEESEKYNQLEFEYASYDLDSIFAKKNKALILHHQKQYDESIQLLLAIKPKIIKNESYSWVMIIDQYLGENYLKKGNPQKAKLYYNEVIKQFNKYKIVNNEIRLTFERLINFAKQEQNKDAELQAINNLLEYDKVYFETNNFLAKAYSKNYEQSKLEAEKKALEKQKKYIIYSCLVIVLIAFIIAFISYNKSQKNKKKLLEYIEEIKISSSKNNSALEQPNDKENTLSTQILTQIENATQKFELHKGYLNPAITLAAFAKENQINKNQLSIYFNSIQHKNFKQYVNELRINYIVKRIIEDKKIRSLTIDAMAEKAGFNSRKTFSNSFLQHTGFRPSYFVKNLKEK